MTRAKGTKKEKSSPSSTRPRRVGRWLLGIGAALAILAVLTGTGLAAVFWYYGRDLPSVDSLRHYEPPQTTRVIDRHGRLLGELFTERRTVVPMSRIPRVLVLSVLAAEDADFYIHTGADYPGLFRAAFRSLVTGRQPRGTSTITQQVVKLMLLSSEQTVSRKVRELILARRLEQELSKEEILHLYLNHINFGHGRYGAQEAAQFYFHKDAKDLDLAEASLIAGIPQSPTRLSPLRHPEAARRRQRFVLAQLERKRATRWPDLARDDIVRAREAPPPLAERDASRSEAPEVVALARKQLKALVDAEAYARGGFTVETSIDLRWQKAARKALQKELHALDARQRYQGPLVAPRRRRRPKSTPTPLSAGRTYDAVVTGVNSETGLLELTVGKQRVVAPIPARYNPKRLRPPKFAQAGARARVSITHVSDRAQEASTAALELGPNGSVIVIDPRNREVRCLIGGYASQPGFNRATMAVRQPGSAFKPLVYALGVRSRRYTPASVVIDAPAVYDQWKPKNYETWNYQGAIRLRQALAKSVNLVAVRVIEDLSPQETIGFARQLGLATELEPNLGLALGASAVRPIELVNAYATFAAGGRWEPVRIITRIKRPDGQELPLPTPEAARRPLSEAEAYVVTSLLTSVVRHGTGAAAQRLARPVAGKTGTSNQARDAWFVGYTARTVAGVWVGFDDNRPLGRRENGGKTALPIWMEVVHAIEKDLDPLPFSMPSGVVTASIDPASGLLAYEGMEGALEEVFLEGTVPTETARSPDVADPQSFLMEQVAGG